jgi:hypothetical protein
MTQVGLQSSVSTSISIRLLLSVGDWLLGLSTKHVRRLIAPGELPLHPLGGGGGPLRVGEAGFERWLEEQR